MFFPGSNIICFYVLYPFLVYLLTHPRMAASVPDTASLKNQQKVPQNVIPLGGGLRVLWASEQGAGATFVEPFSLINVYLLVTLCIVTLQ